MNERKIVKEKFDFLLNYGFDYSYEKTSSIVFTLEYQKGDIVIIPGYDFREHDFGVGLRDLNNTKNIFYVDILETEIGTLKSRTKLEELVMNIYLDSKKYYFGMPKKHFESIVSLYADFIKENLNDILNWKDDFDKDIRFCSRCSIQKDS